MNVEKTPTTVTIVVLTHLLDHSVVPVTLDSLWPVMATPAMVSRLHRFYKLHYRNYRASTNIPCQEMLALSKET